MNTYHRRIENFLRGGGGVAASHDYFCSPFDPERRVAALKMAKNDLFGKIFRPKGGEA